MSSVSVGEGSKCTDKLKSLTRLEGEKPSFNVYNVIMFWEEYKSLLEEILDVPPIKLELATIKNKRAGFDGEKILMRSFDITIDNLYSLAHEFYHYYQSKHMKNFDKQIKNYKDVGEMGYEDQLLEKQAFYFQDQIMLYVFGIMVQYNKKMPKSPTDISNDRIYRIGQQHKDVRKQAMLELMKRSS